MKELYNNEKPLLCCEFPSLNRHLGVSVHQYADNHWDVSYQRVSINTASFGKGYGSIDELKGAVTDDTRAIIENLDKVIAELREHRKRLRAELDSIEENGLPLW